LLTECNKKSEEPGASSTTKPAAGGTVFCGGVNSCAGKSACKTQKHACAGKNTCKGEGVLEMTADECRAKGGTIEPRTM
jgi:hypothetical protein